MVPTSSPWSFVAAVGASYIVAGITLAVVGPLLEWVLRFDEFVNAIFYGPRSIGLSGIDTATTLSMATILGALVATFVARRSDGRAAVVLYAALVVSTAALAVTHAIAYQRDIALRPGFYVLSALDMPLGAMLTFLPAVFVVIVGLVAPVRPHAATTRTTNAVLECAGAYGLAGIVASLALLPSQSTYLLLTPYLLTTLDAGPHAAVVVSQAIVAAVTYALRSRVRFSPSTLLVLLATGVAAALPTDITPIGLTVFAGWTYVPLSLVLIPLTTLLLIVAASEAHRRTGLSRRHTT